VDKHIEILKSQGTDWNRLYKGQPTKAAFRYERLCQKRRFLDHMRWSKAVMPEIEEANTTLTIGQVRRDSLKA
jgi:hypothetical protein